MKVTHALAFIAAATQSITTAASIPDASNDALSALVERAPATEIVSPDHSLERRKGGGGRGGGGGSSGSGGRSGGGTTYSGGSGMSRGYGGGRYYSGGAAAPYSAGRATPRGRPAGALIAPLALVAIMPGLWLYSTYPYYYNNPYRFRNTTRNSTETNNNNNRRSSSLFIRQSEGVEEELPVMCLCQEFSQCGCEENDDQEYINELVGNGSYADLDKTLVTVSDVNDTKTLVLNGTLSNDTTAPTENAAGALAVGHRAGYLALGLAVVYGVML